MEKSTTGMDLSPHEVNTFRMFLATWAARKHAQYGRLKSKRADYITAKREDYKSIAETERAWEAGEDGKEYLNLHEQLKAVQLLIDCLESTHFLLQQEVKNNM